MTKYMVILGRWPRAQITPIECERESEQSVYVNGRRRGKRTEYENYFDSWEEAHAALLAASTEHLAIARARLQKAQGFHGNVKGMVNNETHANQAKDPDSQP